MTAAAGLALALASTVALNLGWLVQHGAASELPPLEVRHPLRALGVLFGDRRWVLGGAAGIAGWGLYIAALALAPLSLVQGVSAGGLGLLAVAAGRGRSERRAVGVCLVGLVLLAVSLAGGVPTGRTASPVELAGWLAASAAAAGALAGVGGGAALGLAAGTLYAAGDVATKATVDGRWLLVPVVLACSGGGFTALQLAFQRGGALVTAGLNTLATNALPIAAGVAVFGERMPGGAAGVARGAGFAAAVAGACLLARLEAQSERRGEATQTAVAPAEPARHSIVRGE